MTEDIVKSLTPSAKARGQAAGVVSFIADYLTLSACYASIITYLARIFCLSPVSWMTDYLKKRLGLETADAAQAGRP